MISQSSGEVDLEVREIWQPWLRPRCNFAVRYIVPDRVNIIKIMQEKGRFSSEVWTLILTRIPSGISVYLFLGCHRRNSKRQQSLGKHEVQAFRY